MKRRSVRLNPVAFTACATALGLWVLGPLPWYGFVLAVAASVQVIEWRVP